MDELSNIIPVEQKVVGFMGAELLGIKASDKKVYVAVKWVCEGMGLSKGQMQNERKRIQDDLVLSQGERNFVLPTNGGQQEVLCIELDFLPLWLAKISITPKMQEETPWLARILVEYQLKAKDVLAEAFFPKQQPMTQLEVLQNMVNQMVESERRVTQLEQKQTQTENEVKGIRQVVALNSREWRKDTTNIINKIAVKQGGHERFREVRTESYELLEKRAGAKLQTRLMNKRKKMALEGVAKSRIDSVSKLDVIDDDKRLLEIYLAVVKEMAIRNSVDTSELKEVN